MYYLENFFTPVEAEIFILAKAGMLPYFLEQRIVRELALFHGGPDHRLHLGHKLFTHRIQVLPVNGVRVGVDT